MLYLRRIAVLKQINGGFSCDGSGVSGVIRAEQFGNCVNLQISFANFAPLVEGRYVCAFTDGEKTEIFEKCESLEIKNFNIEKGFAFAVLFVRGSVCSVAEAGCGGVKIKISDVERVVYESENPKKEDFSVASADDGKYCDDAIAEDNYYEYESNENVDVESGDNEKEEQNQCLYEDEKDSDKIKSDGQNLEEGALLKGAFFERIKGEVERLFEENPRMVDLENAVENSKWIKINYGKEKYYVFGVVYDCGEALYLCYGVPAKSENKPKSFGRGGVLITTEIAKYWVLYQDAKSGVSLDVRGI